MPDDLGGGYPSELPDDQRDELTRVNAPGLARFASACRRVRPRRSGARACPGPSTRSGMGSSGQLVDAAASRQPRRRRRPATVERLVAEQEADQDKGDY
jgi:hypothetical protein